MKKKKSKVLPVLGFVAAVFFAIFILLEFRNDYLAVAGAGIVMLIAAYFLVDKIERDVFIKEQIERQYMDDKIDEASKLINERCDRLETVQKAIYAVSKMNLNENKQDENEIKSESKKPITEQNAALAEINNK